MARFDKSSTKRPKQDAAVAASRGAKRSTAPSIEDTMFFPRLRRHAKWMFVFLAVALGGGFVLFGVGAGGTGVGDLFRGDGGSSGVPSISSAQKKTEQNPKDVEAWRDLSTALQTDGQTDRGDRRAEAGRRAGAEGRRRAPRARRPLPRAGEPRSSRRRSSSSSGPPTRAPARTSPARSSRRPGSRSSTTRSASCSTRRARRRSRRSSAEAQSRLGRGGRRVQEDRRAAARTTRTSSSSSPRRPSRRATRRRRSPPTTAFLKLAPDDPSASIVKQQLKQLKQTLGSHRDRLAANGCRLPPTTTVGGRLVAVPRRRRGRAVRRRLRRVGRLLGGDGRPDQGQGAVRRRSAAAATRSRTPARRARSARTSTTRSSSRGATGSARARSSRSSGARSPTRSRRPRPERPACRPTSSRQDADDVASYVASVAGVQYALAPADADVARPPASVARSWRHTLRRRQRRPELDEPERARDGGHERQGGCRVQAADATQIATSLLRRASHG